MMETLALIVATVGSSAGAAWAIRAKLAAVEAALGRHVQNDTTQFNRLRRRVRRLEKPQAPKVEET